MRKCGARLVYLSTKKGKATKETGEHRIKGRGAMAEESEGERVGTKRRRPNYCRHPPPAAPEAAAVRRPEETQGMRLEQTVPESAQKQEDKVNPAPRAPDEPSADERFTSSLRMSALGTTVPVRFLQGALVIWVLTQISQFLSFGKRVLMVCLKDTTSWWP